MHEKYLRLFLSSFFKFILNWPVFSWIYRRWRWLVKSGWILHLYLSESQTQPQHGPNRWEPPFSSHIDRKTFAHYTSPTSSFFRHRICSFCVAHFSLTASELARTPGKSVNFSATPNFEPSTPSRTGRSEYNKPSSPFPYTHLFAHFLTVKYFLFFYFRP